MATQSSNSYSSKSQRNNHDNALRLTMVYWERIVLRDELYVMGFW